jgi:hypothetical protein
MDLKEYMAELKKWEPKEKTVFEALADVERSQYVDDDFVVRTLKGALPDAESHIHEVAQYRPKTSDLSEIHERYRRGWDDLKVSLDKMIAALEIKDYVALAKAKNQMQAARADLLKAFQVLDAMLEENEEALQELQKS